MEICRELEKKYKLRVLKNEKEKVSEIYLNKKNLTENNHKQYLNNSILTLMDTYHFKTIGEYTALLSTYDISVRYITGNRFGQKYNGLVYQLKDENGKDKSIPIKASLLSEKCGYKSLAFLMERNKNSYDSGKTIAIKKLLDTGLSVSKSQEEFIFFLKNNGVVLIIRKNKEGRITGATYVDHQSKMVYNGSSLDKKYSANSIEEMFKSKTPSVPLSKENKPCILTNDVDPNQKSEETQSKYKGNNVVEEIFRFTENNMPINMDEIEMNRLRLKKKRKKKGMRM
ncbi:MAG: hypothetical protein LIO65_01035 [Odoribacter sp.]|nr:hypothetical protein [Odoribacter sp.]